MVSRRWPVLPIFFIAIISWAQTSDHQRVGVEKKTNWDAGVETGVSISFDEGYEEKTLNANSFLSLDFSLERTWLIGLYIPLNIETVSYQESGTTTASGIGDLDLYLGYSGRVKDIRYNIIANIGFPTGNPYYISDGPLVTGSGRWTLGLTASSSIIFDPVLLGLSLGYNMGLEKEERFGRSWDPGTFSMSIGITEVLNDSIGYSLRLQHSLSLPLIYEGYSDSYDYSYRIRGAIEVFYNKKYWSIRSGLSKNLNNWSEPVSFSVSCSFNFDSEDFERIFTKESL